MKAKLITSIFVLSACGAMAQNPIIQTKFTADPAPMVWNDTVFLYADHDEDGSTYFTMRDWPVYSSTDMVNWTDRGTPLSINTFAWADNDAWATQCIERGGKFYWYVCCHSKLSNARAIGVAVADHPAGPFRDALGHPLCDGNWAYIDPSVFIDDDGQAYLCWGNPNIFYVKLNDDMISYQGDVQKMQQTEAAFGAPSPELRQKGTAYKDVYVEGPWLYKRNKLYYLLYAAGGIPEHLSYSTAEHPLGPWTYRGIVMPQQGGSFTNHCGVVDYHGRSFLFYHNGALPGGGGFTRSICVEEFAYNADGTFPTINMTTEGVSQPVHNLNPYRRTEAETMAFSRGIRTYEETITGVYTTTSADNAYIKVRSIDFGQKGAKKFRAAVRSTGSSSIELRLDAENGTLISTASITPTANKWKTLSAKVQGATGKHDLFIIFKGTANAPVQMNWWQFK